MELFKVDGNLSIDTSNVYVNGVKSDLSVQKITQDEYAKLLAENACISNVIYVVESNALNAYDERVANVADPVNDSDAVNKKTLCNMMSDLSIALTNIFATKSEVSVELSELHDELDSELSSLSVELTNELSVDIYNLPMPKLDFDDRYVLKSDLSTELSTSVDDGIKSVFQKIWSYLCLKPAEPKY